MRLKNRKKMVTAGIIVLSGIFLFALTSCNPYGSDTDIANVIANNGCGVTVDIFMDGNFQFSVEYLYYKTIENVTHQKHDFVAKKIGTEDVVSTISVDITAGGEYVWTIKSSANIRVINEYGQTLGIYFDGSYLGEIEDQKDQIISSVPYGEHLLVALKTSDSTPAASTTIDIIEDKEYSWTITN